MPRRRACHVESWFEKRSHSRRVIVYDAWPVVGIGHSLVGTARMLQFLMLAAPERSISFAACLPPWLVSVSERAARFRGPGRHEQLRLLAAQRLGRAMDNNILPTLPFCDEAHFDLHEHVSIAGLPSFRATDEQHRALRPATGMATAPDCATMLRLLRGPEPTVGLYYAAAKVVSKCLSSLDGAREHLPRRSDRARGASSGSAIPCLRRFRLLVDAGQPPPPSLPCEYGLHLRTLQLDDVRCNQMSDDPDTEGNCPLAEADRARDRVHSRARVCDESPIDAISGCPVGARFATSDSPSIYGTTRRLGWSDLNESALKTWEGPWLHPASRAGAEASRGGTVHEKMKLTVAAWFTLSRCTRAVIAPVRSAFSESAALTANVPYLGCCSRASVVVNTTSGREELLSAALAKRRRYASSVRRAANAPKHGWLARARQGYCARTTDGVEGDCRAGAKGSWALNKSVATSWRLAAAECTARCAACDRCRYVSLSPRFLDCSWFHQCDIHMLRTDVDGFRSGEVLENESRPALIAELRPGRARGSRAAGCKFYNCW